MMGGCYVCRYCCVKFPNQTPRAIVRHTELYHKSEVTKFLDDPVNHPLQCGSCMWKCRQDLLTFKKHIKFHTSESSQGIRCQPQELNGQFSNTRPNVDLQAHEYDVDETDNSNHPKSDSIDSNSSLRDAMGIQVSDHSDETPVLEGRFENESYTQGDAAERHDILEGIGKLEIRCLLAALTRDKIVTLDYLNQKITSMDYGRHEASNRPSVQRNIDAMRQSASQMWALIRFLPQMIGHLVPIDYPEWAVFLLLRTIMDMVFSPQITYDCTRTLDGLVEEHHSMFIEVFGEDANLTAKAHFMTHYGRCIREHGPLTNFWCMRYESKHRLAKLVASVSCNFKNLPLTVAKRYQIKEYADGQEQQADDVTTKNGVEISGTDYRVGDIIVVSYSHYLGQPMFGKIKSIYTKGGDYHFAYVLVDTIFYSHYHAYQVMYEADELNQISQKLLPTLPASLIHTDNGLIFLCLRHMVI